MQDGTLPQNLANGASRCRIAVPNVTLRSASGNPQGVVLDGNYITTEIIQVAASNVTIAEITLRRRTITRSTSRPAPTHGTKIYRVRVIDPGEQAIKINPRPGLVRQRHVACSHIELTDAGGPRAEQLLHRRHRRAPVAGVDGARNWIGGFWCAAGSPSTAFTSGRAAATRSSSATRS